MAQVDFTNTVRIDCKNLTNYTTLKNRLSAYIPEADEVLSVITEDNTNYILEYTITVTKDV